MATINKRKIGVCILLSIVTAGIYQIYWEYLLVKSTRAIKKDESSCTGEMLCLLFVPFYSLYWWFTRGKVVKDGFAEYGHSAIGNEIAYLVLCIFGLSIISMAIMQNDFNSLSSEAFQSTQRSVQNQKSAKPGRGIREFIRKFFVSLKRKPQNIPLLVLAAAFVVYSLNLTSIANATATINTPNMGQCEFAGMLFSILAFVCFLRAFPKRQKPSKLMLGLLYLMMAVLVFVDSVYVFRVNEALTRSENPIQITADTSYIPAAQNIVTVHIVLIVICAVLIATMPIYGKLLKKINTSIEVEGNEDIGAIDISAEDE